ncbi:MAG TPA: DUF4255 domain-containing protein [Ktedonobacteraceae bacterium]|nr:DUF4255 domain-containing protein [Ktedonobacteraceae bacterium]
MSSALAIASVTAMLKHLLGNALISQAAAASLGDVTITALPPDRIPTGAEERTQLNLYLYRLTPDSGLRHGSMFTSQLTSQKEQQDTLPLALDLHYLLTAYGEREMQAEALLGYAIQYLYETPLLTQKVMRSALASLSSGKGSNAALTAQLASALTDQVEQIRMSAEFLSLEEMSKLWSSLQTRSRLSVTYRVSMVLIENRSAATAVTASP